MESKFALPTDPCPKCGAKRIDAAGWACGSYVNIMGTFVQHFICENDILNKLAAAEHENQVLRKLVTDLAAFNSHTNEIQRIDDELTDIFGFTLKIYERINRRYAILEHLAEAKIEEELNNA